MSDDKIRIDWIWYMRDPRWFWRPAAFVVCLVLGHDWVWEERDGEMTHSDCHRCGA